MISLEAFKRDYSGYLLNDNCNFEVEFLKFHARNVDCNRMYECLSVQKKPTSGSYTLKIDRLSNRHEPGICSDIFDIGGYTWKLDVYHDGAKTKKCLDVYLKLAKTSKLSVKLEVYANVSLCLQDKVELSQVKFTADKKRFGYEDPWRWEFPLVKFEDPSKGFLLKNACVIEVSIVVLGSSTLH
ncbi:ubiquitin carboxyl-terminal hydrolase 12-like [Asparagus officinalis]|uniref:ubiquitin carboxyl-terminal hydrolase 12-like n=1 Tax=Asparagus officinalis TaxID=4686 RepID=UPI00098E08DB|nr:ubiquitin carboxyl-terminal hydrolase 12-like [Asparagus officinalis]